MLSQEFICKFERRPVKIEILVKTLSIIGGFLLNLLKSSRLDFYEIEYRTNIDKKWIGFATT